MLETLVLLGVLIVSATLGVMIGKFAEGAIALYRRRWPEPNAPIR